MLVNTDDPVTESRFLLRTAAITVRGGLSADLALKAVTLDPAQALHLDQQIGSLEKGKDADFVVLSGEPFSVYTRVLETYIDGKQVFDAGRRERLRLYQIGGFAVADPIAGAGSDAAGRSRCPPSKRRPLQPGARRKADAEPRARRFWPGGCTRSPRNDRRRGRL